MSGLRPIIIGFLLAALFAYVLILGGSALIIQNGGGNGLQEEPGIANYLKGINETLYNASTNTKNANDAFTNSSITTTTSIPYVDAIGGIWKTLKTAPVMLYDLTIGLVFTKLLGDQQKIIVISILGVILTITVIFAAWKLIAQGEPDK